MSHEDTARLNWLIEHGYTPAKWRPWRKGDPESTNGLTCTGLGGREEIDAAMGRSESQETKGENAS